MATPAIEPGLLKVFRWYVLIRLGIAVLALWTVRQETDPTNPRFPGAGVLFFGLLAVLLVWKAPQKRLGRWFLPLALALATLGPIIESAANVRGRLDAGLAPSEALVDYWIPFFLLWVPLLLVAWQYRYRAVLAFAAASTLLDLALALPPLQEAGGDVGVVSGLILIRGLLFAFVGLFVAKLVAGQREARRVLAERGTTLEALATSRERNRLARELHDTLAHSLSAVAVQLEAVRSLWDTEPVRAQAMLDDALRGAREGLGEARRAISALRASPLEERGLVGALDLLATTAEGRTAVRVTFAAEDPGNVDPIVEQAVYRIADEAVTNAVRHAGAGAVAIGLGRVGGRLQLEVRDDGKGFDPRRHEANGHHGLVGMEERAAIAGGSLTIESQPGAGTVVRFEVEVAP